MASTRSIKRQKWKMRDYYHGLLRREFVEDRLENEGEFLIRKSSTGSWVVSARWNSVVHHLEPAFDGHQFTFGGPQCDNFEELVKTHWAEKIPISDQNIVLKTPVAHKTVLYKTNDVIVQGKLGEGRFAEVFKVRIVSEDRLAAMKSLKNNVDSITRENFESEVNMMVSVRHPNIVGFIGLVADADRLKLLLELANRGSLDTLLAKRKLASTGKIRVIGHVARGMRYLHERRVIHRDLAARNVLVHRNADGTVSAKVSDFGLSRQDDEGRRGYELMRAQQLPLRWMAPECFEHRRWTMASDVWSYGILMWEVFSGGAEPYGDKPELADTHALTEYVVRGGHPCQLTDIDDHVHELMFCCWKLNPAERPSMEAIVTQLERQFPFLVENP